MTRSGGGPQEGHQHSIRPNAGVDKVPDKTVQRVRAPASQIAALDKVLDKDLDKGAGAAWPRGQHWYVAHGDPLDLAAGERVFDLPGRPW